MSDRTFNLLMAGVATAPLFWGGGMFVAAYLREKKNQSVPYILPKYSRRAKIVENTAPEGRKEEQHE